jgi:hypothetical protein
LRERESGQSGDREQAARDAALKTGMKDGVAVSYNRLADYLQKMT